MDATMQTVERLNSVSQKNVLEPEEMFDWSATGKGAPISLWGVTLATPGDDGPLSKFYWQTLNDDQRAALAREEIAAVLDMGVRMEAVLDAGLSLWIAREPDLADPKVTYALHEIGEETRHSRAFIRMLEQMGQKTTTPALSGAFGKFVRGITGWVMVRPRLLMVIGLAGEEIPDLFQKMSIENPDTDPVLKAVSVYHRGEEARHIKFARVLLDHLWNQSGRVPLRDRFYMRYVMPRHIHLMFMGNIHPNVYKTVGLPTWKTWLAVNRCGFRKGLRHQACRNVLSTLTQYKILTTVPRGWRNLCGVDQLGRPVG